MTPAPLPPHERQWRHPSELAPTVADVESGSHGRGLIIATGTAAAMLAAVMVIALTPPRSSSPSAVSATTIPAVAVQQQQEQEQRSASRGVADQPQGVIRIDSQAANCSNVLALTDAPQAVTADVDARPRSRDVAARIPRANEPVVILTDSHACELTWSQIDRVAAPDGSIVVTRSGETVGEFVDGALSVLVD